MAQIQRNERKDGEKLSTSTVLNTKVMRPRLRTPYVERDMLCSHLDRALGRPVTLVSAPAGFGKTHLISHWLSRTPGRAAWLALDNGDNDPMRFVRHMIAALHGSGHADVGGGALAALDSAHERRLDMALEALLADMSRMVDQLVFVLDDYHLITSPFIHELLAFLIEQSPDALHVVIVTRVDPPLPLARWRAHGHLFEVRSDDLRFSHTETVAFLRQSLPHALPKPCIAQLEEVTEGWIVGLRLAVLSLLGHDTTEWEQRVATFAGNHRHVLDYLYAEVLSVQPEAWRDFLLRIAFLDRLSGPLCDTVTRREDSGELLQSLERANLFLIRLDDAATWYRLHTLAAEALQHMARQQLGENTIRELFRRASDWYEGHGLLSEAVEAALAADDAARAAVIIERLIEPQLMKRSHEYYTLRRWLERLPDEVLARHPTLCLTFATAVLFTSDRHAAPTARTARKLLRMAEEAWSAEMESARLGEVLALRSLVEYWQGDYMQMFESSRKALDLLAESQTEWRAVTMLNLAIQEYLSGDTNAARCLAEESQRLNRVVGNEYLKRSSLALLGYIALCQGNLYEAEQRYRELLALSARQPHDQVQARIGLAAVAFERDDRAALQADLADALAAAEQTGDKHLLVEATILMARFKHAQDNVDSARRMLQALAAQLDMPVHVRELRAWDAWLALMSGDTATVSAWQLTCVQPSPFALQNEREALIQARLLLAQGKPQAALSILDRWYRDSVAGGRARATLDILILQALAYHADRQLPQAHDALHTALGFAHKAGYVRPLMQEGEALATLIRSVPTGNNLDLAAFRYTLLRDLGDDQTVNEVAARLNVFSATDPLSPQEQRVFLLMAEGASNPDIARSLGVSINTIKTQVKSIYSKLNIRSRRQAREMARVLFPVQ